MIFTLTSKGLRYGLIHECTMSTITGRSQKLSRTIEAGLLRCHPNDTQEGTGNHLRTTEINLQKIAFDVQNLSQINWYPINKFCYLVNVYLIYGTKIMMFDSVFSFALNSINKKKKNGGKQLNGYLGKALSFYCQYIFRYTLY